MSYCRDGEDSDLYMYAGAMGLSMHITSKTELDEKLPYLSFDGTNSYGENMYQSFTPNSEIADAMTILVELAAHGVKIPERAVRRLAEEMIRGEWSEE